MNSAAHVEDMIQSILKLASKLVKTRTFFLSRTGNEQFSVYKVLNKNGCPIKEGELLSLAQSF